MEQKRPPLLKRKQGVSKEEIIPIGETAQRAQKLYEIKQNKLRKRAASRKKAQETKRKREADAARKAARSSRKS